jgi:hypothetical protein
MITGFLSRTEGSMPSFWVFRCILTAEEPEWRLDVSTCRSLAEPGVKGGEETFQLSEVGIGSLFILLPDVSAS